MNNTVASVIKFFAVICFIILLIGGVALGNTYQTAYVDFNWPLAIGIWVSGGILCLVLFGIGEIISILQSIKNYAFLIQHYQENMIDDSDSKDN